MYTYNLINVYEIYVGSVIFAHADVFTVEEAIEKLGFGPFQILITIFSGMLWVSY